MGKWKSEIIIWNDYLIILLLTLFQFWSFQKSVRRSVTHSIFSIPKHDIFLTFRVLFENRPALYFCNYKEN